MHPENTYFIRGLKHWNGIIDLVYSEISISLQKDGHTKPLRDFGFIIEVKPEGIIAAFDRDVTSKIDNGRKILSDWSNKNWNNYSDMNKLIENTRADSHNEIWVLSEFAEIIGGYIVGSGRKSFEKQMIRSGYNVHRII